MFLILFYIKRSFPILDRVNQGLYKSIDIQILYAIVRATVLLNDSTLSALRIQQELGLRNFIIFKCRSDWNNTQNALYE